ALKSRWAAWRSLSSASGSRGYSLSRRFAICAGSFPSARSMMVWPVLPLAMRSAEVRTRLVVSQPDMIEAMVRINSEERKVDRCIGALYRFCRGLQGNELVALVCLVSLVCLVFLVDG